MFRGVFHPAQAVEAFHEYLTTQKQALAMLTPVEAFEWFFRFYSHRRAEGVDLTQDGDMLLYQWGTFDWGDGRKFELDLARQFLVAGEPANEEPHQLRLRYAFEPTPELDALGSGSHWCPGPDEVSVFAEWVRAHPATKAVGMRTDGERSVVLEAG